MLKYMIFVWACDYMFNFFSSDFPSLSLCPKNIYRRRCAIVGILNSLKIMMKFTVICSKIRLFFRCKEKF